MGKRERCQGDCGNCKAYCRCCLPALAGFVSPHSTGPGEVSLREQERSFKRKCNASLKWSHPYRLKEGGAACDAPKPASYSLISEVCRNTPSPNERV